MKIAKRAMVAIIAILCVVAPASAQFRWGIKAGANINKIHFSESVLNDITDAENRAGWCAGLTTEFTVPIIGIGLDASVLFSHRVIGKDADNDNLSNNYIDIPINLKYKFSFPVISNFLVPYLYTGPDFAFLCSKRSLEAFYNDKTCDVSWDLGLGVQLLNHLQISAQYGWGLNKIVECDGGTAKLNGWMVGAAYLF